MNESVHRDASNAVNRSCVVRRRHSKLHSLNDKIVIGRRRRRRPSVVVARPTDRLVDSRNAALAGLPTPPTIHAGPDSS